MTRLSTRPPSQNPVFLNSHSKQPVSGQFQLQTPFFASRGCWLTKASDVQARRKSLSPYHQWLSTAPVLASPQTSFLGLFVTHSFLPHGPWGRNECVTNEPQRTSAGRLLLSWLLVDGKTFLAPSCLTLDQTKPIFQAGNIEEEGWRWGNLLPGAQNFSLIIWNGREKALGRRNRNLISIRTCFWCRMMTPLQGWVQIRIWRVMKKEINLQRILTSGPN